MIQYECLLMFVWDGSKKDDVVADFEKERHAFGGVWWVTKDGAHGVQ